MVVVCILLALSKFSLVPWQTDLAFYGKNANFVNTMILTVDFTLKEVVGKMKGKGE